MSRFDENKHMLIALSKCKTKLRNSIISNADKETIFSICECILNVMNGNIKLSEDDYKKLKPYRHTFKRLLNKSNLKTKKKILIQKGGFLQFLLPAAITAIGSIISAIIKK